MPTLNEMTAWSIEEIRAEIHVALPPGWRFEMLLEQDEPRARFIGPDDAVIWWHTGADERLLLLNAYGWLWMRQQKTVNPAWTPRSQRQLVPVQGVTAHGPQVPDPEDLDPAEIASVYSGSPQTKR